MRGYRQNRLNLSATAVKNQLREVPNPFPKRSANGNPQLYVDYRLATNRGSRTPTDGLCIIPFIGRPVPHSARS